VLACPPSAGYRLRKFVRRHKGPVVAASLILLCLIGGIIGTTSGMVRAINAENATRIEVLEKDKAKKQAEDQAAVATSITHYLQQMLRSIDPLGGKGVDYTVRQLLADYARDLEKQLPDQPEVEASLQATIGRAYTYLGQQDKARKHLERALVLHRGVFGEDHEKYAESLADWARTDADPSEYPQREADVRRALAIYRARGVRGEKVIAALSTLRYILRSEASAAVPGKWDEIEPVVNEALAEAASLPGVEFPEIASIYHGLVEAKIAQSRFAEAETIGRVSLAMHLRLHGLEHFETAWGYFHLGDALRGRHKFAEAIQLQKQALTIMRKIVLPESGDIAWGLNALLKTLALADESHALADVFPSLADFGELESVFLEVLRTTKRSKLDGDYPVLAAARGLVRFIGFYCDLSRELASRGRTKEAEDSRRKANLLLESLQTEFAGIPEYLPYLGRAYHRLAWFLATAVVPAHRDPVLAIELAKKAVERDRQASIPSIFD